MPSNKVLHFEIPADDPERIAKFYTDVFGWKISQWGKEPYWLAETGPRDEPGIGGAIYKKDDKMSVVVNTIGVDDVDAYVEKVKNAGGELVSGPMEIPEVGRHAMLKDPEGTLFGIIKPLPM